MKSKEMSRKTKMRVYRVAIRPVVTCGAGTMILIKDEEEKLRRFERRIVKKIYCPKKVVEGVYQRLMNSKAQESLQGVDIVKAIMTQRLPWDGHIRRMGEKRVVTKVT